MKIASNIILITAICIIGLTGCGSVGKEEQVAAKRVMETVETDRNKEKEYFPEYYAVQTRRVKIDCVLEVPEKFDMSNFYLPTISGYTIINLDKVYEKFVKGKDVKEEYHDPGQVDYEKERDTYILDDDTVVSIAPTFVYGTADSATYRHVVRSSEHGAPKSNFLFASGENCVEEVKEILEEIECPVDEYQFDWFSTSGEEYALLEKNAVDDQAVDSQYIKQDGWTERDNAYEIYAWQTYEKLPIFPLWMTTAKTRALENYQKAPISALYTEKGMLSLSINDPALKLEETDDKAKFLTFDEIAAVLTQRYEDLLEEDNTVHTVTRAKLALRTYYDEKQNLAVTPIWYFEVNDGEETEIVLIDAISGDEIFLN